MTTRRGRPAKKVVLIDANAIIESVRIRIWKAVVGGRQVETVPEVRDEPLNGNPHRPGRVTVTTEDLDGLAAVRTVTQEEHARFLLEYEDGAGMDRGEQYLMAHAFARTSRGDDAWEVCSPDKASVRAAVALNLDDQLISLEEIVESVGARPPREMYRQYTKDWLSEFRTKCLLNHKL